MKPLDKGLPSSIDSEKFVLGSVLLDGQRISDVAAVLDPAQFALEKHRRIFQRMLDLDSRGEKIDRVTIANELLRYNELEACDGLTYLVSLDEGLPQIANLDAYIKLVKDKAALRSIAVTAQHLLNRALANSESPDDILAAAEEQLVGIGETRQGSDDGLLDSGEFLRNFPGGFQSFVEPSRRDNGLRTGFTKFDEMTGGLRPGELIIVGARPSVGKSAWVGNVAWNAATKLSTPVGFFSLEMSRESLLLRMLCSAARVDSQRLRAGYLNEQERARIRAAANQMLEAPIFIDDASNVGLMELHSKIRRLEKKRKIKLGLVIVDYLQLMSSRGKSENRNTEMERLTRGLKLLSKDLGCPFLVLSQLSRESDKRTGDGRPQLSDLRQSGAIEQDADIVAFLYRAEMVKKDRDDLRGLAELIIAKQRAGPRGTVELVFMDSIVTFTNRADDMPPEDGRLPYAD